MMKAGARPATAPREVATVTRPRRALDDLDGPEPRGGDNRAAVHQRRHSQTPWLPSKARNQSRARFLDGGVHPSLSSRILSLCAPMVTVATNTRDGQRAWSPFIYWSEEIMGGSWNDPLHARGDSRSLLNTRALEYGPGARSARRPATAGARRMV